MKLHPKRILTNLYKVTYNLHYLTLPIKLYNTSYAPWAPLPVINIFNITHFLRHLSELPHRRRHFILRTVCPQINNIKYHINSMGWLTGWLIGWLIRWLVG